MIDTSYAEPLAPLPPPLANDAMTHTEVPCTKPSTPPNNNALASGGSVRDRLWLPVNSVNNINQITQSIQGRKWKNASHKKQKTRTDAPSSNVHVVHCHPFLMRLPWRPLCFCRKRSWQGAPPVVPAKAAKKKVPRKTEMAQLVFLYLK